MGVRLAAIRQGSPASALEPRICWLSGTEKPRGHMAGNQTKGLWARREDKCKLGLVHRWQPSPKIIFTMILGPPSHLAWLCVFATPWLWPEAANVGLSYQWRPYYW